MKIAEYWERRYSRGKTSGAGSEGRAAKVKASYVRDLIRRERVASIIDWGCGDGVVLKMINPAVPYLGIDVSRTIVSQLKAAHRRRKNRRFILTQEYGGECADLALSLDVIFHQVSDANYRKHMHQLFGSAQRLVLIHSSDHDAEQEVEHVLWRHWSTDVARWFPEWEVIERPSDPTKIGFHLYRRSEL